MAEYKKHYGGQPVVDEEPLYNGAVFYVEDPAQLESVMEQVQAMDCLLYTSFYIPIMGTYRPFRQFTNVMGRCKK